MRPPDHWHLRHRRRRQGRWGRPAALGLLAISLVIATAWFWPRGGSGGQPERAQSSSSVAAAESSKVSKGDTCSSGDCTPSPAPDFAAGNVPPPKIRGRSAYVIEDTCGAVLYSYNASARFRPASLTKIATALVAAEHTQLSRVVDVRVNSQLMAASTGSSVMGLEPGMRMPIRDLLYGLLLPSGNDAAVEIAQDVAGNVPAFVQLMNDKAAAMQLKDTHFANPHGLDENAHYTSARDIAELGRALLANPELAAIVRTKQYHPAWDLPDVWNGNELLDAYPGAIGVKIGYTEKAGQTIVAAAERDGRRVIVSVLSTWDRFGDATQLLDWAFTNTPAQCAGRVARP